MRVLSIYAGCARLNANCQAPESLFHFVACKQEVAKLRSDYEMAYCETLISFIETNFCLNTTRYMNQFGKEADPVLTEISTSS